jgi:hypothetical protein
MKKVGLAMSRLVIASRTPEKAETLWHPEEYGVAEGSTHE